MCMCIQRLGFRISQIRLGIKMNRNMSKVRHSCTEYAEIYYTLYILSSANKHNLEFNQKLLIPLNALKL